MKMRVLAIVAVSVCTVLGQGCGSVNGSGSGTLVNQTTGCTIEQDGFCRTRINFTPTSVGGTITVQVSADRTGSRAVFGVNDANGNTVANFDNPTTSSSTTSFTAQSTAAHQLTVRELVDPAVTYTVVVTQN